MRTNRLQTVASAFVAIVSLTGFLASCSGQTVAEADNRKTSIAQPPANERIFGGKATIALPEGFRIATKDDIETHAKRGSAGNELFIGPVEGRSIATEILTDLQTYEGTLAEMKRFNEGTEKRYSSWERSEIVNVKGREWYVFEWKMPEPGNDLTKLVAPPDETGETEKPDNRLRHHIEYFTIIDGLVHRISFTALSEDMPNAKKEFQAAFDSLAFEK